ncbi:hypothetical protein, partial [Mycobacterium sp. 852002-10029_SCH5224772]|uniref:hypothetical protein n=1 Tax=Mycobacterium sp. 852002-10029_SCH5224772 TaxID=1834083 RepID=UPI001E34727E
VLWDGRPNYRNPETELLSHMVTASRPAPCVVARRWANASPSEAGTDVAHGTTAMTGPRRRLK